MLFGCWLTELAADREKEREKKKKKEREKKEKRKFRCTCAYIRLFISWHFIICFFFVTTNFSLILEDCFVEIEQNSMVIAHTSMISIEKANRFLMRCENAPDVEIMKERIQSSICIDDAHQFMTTSYIESTETDYT